MPWPSILFLLLLSTLVGWGETPAELYQAGRYEEVEDELEYRLNSLAAQSALSPDDQLEKANTLLALGMARLALAREEAAITAFREALEDYESVDAPPALRANALDNLARAQQQIGQLSEAEATFREALTWRERDQLDHSHHWLAITNDHLALLLLTSGSYREAGELLATNLAATPESEVALRAQRHHYYARYLHTIRNYHRAIEHAQLSVKLARQIPSLDLSGYLDLLALSQYRSGDQAGAEATLLEALQELRSQPVNLTRARSEGEILNKIGEFSLTEEPGLARHYFEDALAGLSEWLPDDHPSLAVYRNNLGLALMRLGAHQEAEEAFTTALSLLEDEVDGLSLAHQRRAEWRQNIAWNAFLAGDEEKSMPLIREACAASESTLQYLIAEGNETERLNFLSHFDLYSLPAAAGDGELLGGMLARNKSRLLDTLIARGTSDQTVSSSEERLPAQVAFIDYVRYERPTADGWQPHYAAVVESAGRPRQFIPLGTERLLLRWLNALAERLSYRAIILGGGEVEPPLIRLEAALRQLHQHFLAPVLAALPSDMETLVFSPDGSLHFLPFSVLLDPEGRFFSQSYPRVLFVSSRRDLFHRTAPIDLARDRWELFGVSRYESAPQGEPWFLEELADLPFVAKELKELEKQGPDSSRLTLDPAQPETELKKLTPGAAVLHLATHAFFREPDGDEMGLWDLDANPEILLRSGLALSSAEADNDGILYPHEIAKLPLQETQLVTLSACQTGLGTPLAGEGVLGLRRAFATAGAQNILMTLWKVPDQSTATFMSDFYRRAIQSGTIGPALWSLQRDRLGIVSPDLSDDASLEEAVLRYGPFTVTHRGPVPLQKVPQPSPRAENRVFWWRYAAWVFIFGTLIVVVIRVASKRGHLEE